jgi:hypothetical protein
MFVEQGSGEGPAATTSWLDCEELEKTKQVSYKSKIQREPSRTNYETGFNLAAVILSIN